MDQIRRHWRDLSLRKSIILYLSVFAVLAVFLSAATSALCDRAEQKIYESYPAMRKRYYLTTEAGERLGEGAYVSSYVPPLRKRDEILTSVLELLPAVATPAYSALCIMAAALLFYRDKLKKPLAELRAASEKISDNELDFAIAYDSKDELGQLCASFEIMRRALAHNFSEMWRLAEERRQLNAAFAHDLRTPLTVLKGYNEMLQSSGHLQTRETAATMGKHLARMEAYASSMGSLRRMEDTQPECRPVSLRPFLSSLYESADIVCNRNGKTLLLQNKVSLSQLSLDSSFISQVCNNLIANAVRYAKTTVTLSFAVQDSGLLLSVSDDGKGFEKDILHKAADPCFTEETDRSEHFGLGKYAFDGNGREGSGKAAVEIDQEIAAKYAGTLTDEKVLQMMSDFAPKNDLHGMNAAYLYQNAMQSAAFVRFSDMEGNWNGRSVSDVFGEEEIRIGYVDGWLSTSRNMAKVFIVLSLAVILMIAPVFSGEYEGG